MWTAVLVSPLARVCAPVLLCLLGAAESAAPSQSAADPAKQVGAASADDFRSQDPELNPQAGQAESDLLEARSRTYLHPDQPLRLRGLEIDGNDLRSRTPALTKSDKQVTLVDQDELYARTLAMYAGGGGFDTPPSTVGRRPRTEAAEEVEAVPALTPRKVASDSASWVPLAVWAGLLLALGLLLIAWPRIWARLGRWADS
jgi:hypothetical protein